MDTNEGALQKCSCWLLEVISEHVRDPVDAVEEAEHEWEKDARHHVDSLRAGGELVQPALAPILPARRWHVHFATTLERK